MRFQRPSLTAQIVAFVFAAGQAWWLLTVDRFAPERFGPLFPELWQQLLGCIMVDVIVLLVASTRPGHTVARELLCDVTHSILIGALLAFFAIQGMYFIERMSLMATLASTTVPLRTRLVSEFVYAWPLISLFVMCTTAGNSPLQLPVLSRPSSK